VCVDLSSRCRGPKGGSQLHFFLQVLVLHHALLYTSAPLHRAATGKHLLERPEVATASPWSTPRHQLPNAARSPTSAPSTAHITMACPSPVFTVGCQPSPMCTCQMWHAMNNGVYLSPLGFILNHDQISSNFQNSQNLQIIVEFDQINSYIWIEIFNIE
jgi:hypothetical protein